MREEFGAQLVIASGLPPVHSFPALPQPLRWFLGRRASQFDLDLQRDVGPEARSEFLSLRFSDDIALIASDGFHPGPGVSREWARRVAVLVKKRHWELAANE